jgi:hypothetical protein
LNGVVLTKPYYLGLFDLGFDVFQFDPYSSNLI